MIGPLDRLLIFCKIFFDNTWYTIKIILGFAFFSLSSFGVLFGTANIAVKFTDKDTAAQIGIGAMLVWVFIFLMSLLTYSHASMSAFEDYPISEKAKKKLYEEGW